MPRKKSTTGKTVKNRLAKRTIAPDGSSLLESQLAKVVVDQSAVPSNGAHYHAPLPRQTRRKTSAIDAVSPVRPKPEFSRDRVRELDGKLLEHVEKKTTPNAKRVSLRFAAHASSPHVLSVGSIARAPITETRLALDASVWHWLAPYEQPPSLEWLAAEANDLYVGEVDPRLFVDQFTPPDADAAFGRSYNWFNKLLSPFIRWELVSYGSLAPQRETDPPIFFMPETVSERIDAVALQAEQFTANDHDQAFRNVYGWRVRMRSAWQRLWQQADLAVEEARDAEQDLIVQTERAWHAPILVPRLDLVRVMAGFFGLLIMVSLPAGAVSLARSFGQSVHAVVESGTSAISDIQNGIHGDAATQAAAWNKASDRFRAANDALSQANGLATALAQALPQTRELYQSARSLITAGDQASQAGSLLSTGLTRAMQDPGLRLDERLLILATYLDEASPRLDEATKAMANVRLDKVPADSRAKLETLAASLATAQTSLRDLRAITRLAVDIVGHDRPHTFLLAFQNQTEIRPTGGFMGSLAEIVMDQGEVKSVFVPGGGPYDFRNQLLARVVPPKPLQLVAARWEFQDANWFPDFPAAAQKINWFWSKSGQPTLDGVITVNASLMEKLLAVTGPIEMPAYGKTITAENFLMETQKAVELEYDKTENKPKKIIGDLMQEILKRIKSGSQEDWLNLVALLGDAVETKDVQVYLTDAKGEAMVERLGWSSQIKPTDGDALAVVEANIAGQKTDAVIDEKVTHEVNIQEDGSVIDTVTLDRKHNGQHGELFRGANNVAYVRLYVPKGSELLEASGFQTPSSTYFKHPLAEDPVDADVERLVKDGASTVANVDVTEEFGRTSFGGWVQLEPGQSQTTSYRYRLPFSVFDLARTLTSQHPEDAAHRAAYTLLLTSQSGKANRRIETHITVPLAWRSAWSSGFSENAAPSSFNGTWDRDHVVAQLFDVSAP